MRAFGKYRLVEPVASGGMAEVWRAQAPGAEGFVKDVALKLIRGDHDARGDFVRMFVQEARLASRLSHANIVQVFDFDQVDGRYYIAMELVRGRTLREVVDRCREQGVRFGLARAVHVCAEVARALAYAHGLEEGGAPAGLVHRDVSPQNVLVSFEGEVKLTDFGIARALGASEVTAPGTVKGKLAYMAPEQARGEPVDARADVFSLGVVLWELCAGRRLFARDTDASTLAALLSPEPLSPPSAWNEAVPPALDEVALAALERDPARRTASAEALASALAALRLELAERHEDLDLRALVRRLWPEGAATQPRATAAATVVREAAATVVQAAAATAVHDAADTVVREARGTVAFEDLTTRTAKVVRPPARWRAAMALGVVAVAVAAAAGWVSHGRAGRSVAPPGAEWEARARGVGATATAPTATATAPTTTATAPTPTATASTPTATAPTPTATAPTPTATAPTPTATAPTPTPTATTSTGTATPVTATPAAIASTGGSSAAMRVPSPAASGGMTDRASASRRERSAPRQLASAEAVRPATLDVYVKPYGMLSVDGGKPFEVVIHKTVSLPPGRHTLRLEREGAGAEELVLPLAAGERRSWTPALPAR